MYVLSMTSETNVLICIHKSQYCCSMDLDPFMDFGFRLFSNFMLFWFHKNVSEDNK